MRWRCADTCLLDVWVALRMSGLYGEGGKEGSLFKLLRRGVSGGPYVL